MAQSVCLFVRGSSSNTHLQICFGMERNRLKKLFVLMILPGLLVLGFNFDPTRAEESTELSPYGSSAIGELAGCLRTSNSLDVYYLIDASLSLKETDPNNERAKIISQDLARWSDIGAALPDLEINVAGSKFNATTSYLSGWQNLTAQNAKTVAASFTSSINNGNLGNYTNWRVGIDKAYSELKNRNTSCKVMIWFTDGGLWSAEPRINSLKDLEYLCGPAAINDVSKESSSDGLMAQVRRSGIHVFGIMLKDSDAKKSMTKKERDEESYYSSLMKPVVEEAGSVTASPGHKAADMKCGENLEGEEKTYASGAFLQGASAAEVAFKFMKIPALVAGGTVETCQQNGNFAVDPGIGKIEFQTDAKSWQILNSKGEIFKTSEDVKAVNTTTKLALPKLTKPEEWKFVHSGGSGICSLYVYPEIYLELHDKALVTGRESSITGQFFGSLTSHEKVDFSIYEKVSLQATVENESRSVHLENKTGSFEISNYTPSSGKESISVSATLKLETEHYKLNPVTFRLNSRVVSSAGLPDVSKIQFISSISGSKGQAVAKTLVKAPTQVKGESWVCFRDPEVIADDQSGFGGKPTDRGKSWTWKNTGLNNENCVHFSIGANRDQEVSFSVSNKIQANARSEALFAYQIIANDLELKDSQTAKFETQEQTSPLAFWIWFVLSLILGLAIPGLILGYLNYRNAAYQTDGLYRAEIPVEYDSESGNFRALDFNASDFESAIRYFNAAIYPSMKTKSLSDPPENSYAGVNTILHSPVIQLTARNSWLNPMRGPIFTSKPLPGNTTISSTGEKPSKSGEQVLTSNRLNRFAYLVFDSNKLAAAAHQRHNIKGVLVVMAGESIRAGDFTAVHEALTSPTMNEKLQELVISLEKELPSANMPELQKTDTQMEQFLRQNHNEGELNFGSNSDSISSSYPQPKNKENDSTTDLDFS
jgi:hypothetical protein